MKVSVIIINFNTFDLTVNCIRSVITHTKGVAYEIVLVDNASTKDNPDKFLELFPGIRLVKSAENGGFAKGNNLGIRHATGDIILLLNSDTILTEDSISVSAHCLSENSRFGVITVRLVYEDGKYQNNARAFRSIRNEILDLLRPLLFLVPYRTRAEIMLNQYFKGDFNTFCDWVSGAYMMFRTNVLEHLPENKLDERFFMYAEDQLWCYQLKQKGCHCYFLSDTTVIHIGNASTEKAKQLKLLNTMLTRELEIMKIRKGGGFYYFVFSMIFVIKEKARYYIKQLVYTLFKHKIR